MTGSPSPVSGTCAGIPLTVTGAIRVSPPCSRRLRAPPSRPGDQLIALTVVFDLGVAGRGDRLQHELLVLRGARVRGDVLDLALDVHIVAAVARHRRVRDVLAA